MWFSHEEHTWSLALIFFMRFWETLECHMVNASSYNASPTYPTFCLGPSVSSPAPAPQSTIILLHKRQQWFNKTWNCTSAELITQITSQFNSPKNDCKCHHGEELFRWCTGKTRRFLKRQRPISWLSCKVKFLLGYFWCLQHFQTSWR